MLKREKNLVIKKMFVFEKISFKYNLNKNEYKVSKMLYHRFYKN